MNSPKRNFNPDMQFTVISSEGTLHNILAPLDLVLEAIQALHDGDNVTMEVLKGGTEDEYITIDAVSIMFNKDGYNVGAYRRTDKSSSLIRLVFGKKHEVVNWHE